MKLFRFEQFINEKTEDKDILSLIKMGLIDNYEDAIKNAIEESEYPIFLEKCDNVNGIFTVSTDFSLDDDTFESIGVTADRGYNMYVDMTVDLTKSTETFRVTVSNKSLGLDDTKELSIDLDSSTISEMLQPAELGEYLVNTLNDFVSHGPMEDGIQYTEAISLVIDSIKGYAESDYEEDEEDDTVLEKKKLVWHDSDAPDANGKFKELGVQKLADWLIKTRGGDMQKIVGSLNQQIAFNKKKNPSYAKKMESTREAVKRKIGKKK